MLRFILFRSSVAAIGLAAGLIAVGPMESASALVPVQAKLAGSAQGSGKLTCVAWYGKEVLAGGLNGVVHLFKQDPKAWTLDHDIQDLLSTRSAATNASAVFCLAVSSKGDLLATGCFDRAARLWPLTSAFDSQPLQTSGPVLALAGAGDRQMAAAVGNSVYVWENRAAAFGPPDKVNSFGLPSPVASLSWVPRPDRKDDGAFVVGLDDGKIVYWPTCSPVRFDKRLPFNLIETPDENDPQQVIPVVPPPAGRADGAAVAMSVGRQGFVRRWNLAAAPPEFSGKMPKTFHAFALSGPPTKRRLAIATGKKFSVWGQIQVDLVKFSPKQIWSSPDNATGDKIDQVAANDDGTQVLTADVQSNLALFTKPANPGDPPVSTPLPAIPPLPDMSTPPVSGVAISPSAGCVALAVDSSAAGAVAGLHWLYLLAPGQAGGPQWTTCTNEPTLTVPIQQLQFAGKQSQWLLGRSGYQLLVFSINATGQGSLVSRPPLSNDDITAYALSDDFEHLCIGTRHGVICVYQVGDPNNSAWPNIGNSGPQLTLRVCSNPIRSLHYRGDPESPRLVSVDDQSTTRVWDLATLSADQATAFKSPGSRQLQVFTHDVQPACVRLLDNGTTLLALAPDTALQLKELSARGLQRIKLPGTKVVSTFPLAGADTRGVLLVGENTCSVWADGPASADLQAVANPKNLGTNLGRVCAAAVVQDESGVSQIVTGSDDKTIRFWKADDSHQFVQAAHIVMADKIVALTPTGDGALFALLKTGAYFLVWTTADPAAGVQSQALKWLNRTPPANFPPLPLAVARDTSTLVTGNADGSLHFAAVGPVAVYGGQEIDASPSSLYARFAHRGPIYGLAFAPAGGGSGSVNRLATADADGLVRVWPRAAGNCSNPAQVLCHDGTESSFSVLSRSDPLAWSAYGVSFVNPTRLVSTGAAGDIKFWDMPAQKPTAKISAGPGGDAGLCCAVNADGTKLAVGRQSGTITIYDTAPPGNPQPVASQPRAIVSLAFCPLAGVPAPVLAVVTADGQLLLESGADSAPADLGNNASLKFVAVAPNNDGTQLAAAGDDGNVYFFNVTKH